MVRMRWSSGLGILAGGVTLCMLALPLGAQEITAPSTLCPASLLRAIADEVSGTEALAHVLEVTPYERNRPSSEYGTGTYREAAYMAAKAREYGFSDVTIERFPQEQLQWDGEAAELWVEEPVRKLITRYREVTATLVPGSTSADVTAELVYVGPGDSESHYAGADVKGKIVLASGPVRVVHDLAVRKFGAAGVASFHNAAGSPVERPDQIAWGRLTPVPVDAEEPGAGPTTAFGFALSHRMGMELLGLLDKHPKVIVRAKVKATEYPVDLQVVVATIRGDGSIRESEKTEVVFCGHLFEGIAKQGANDNAAGPAVQLELGRAWINLINDGVLPRPKRTIRFLWLPEFTGTRAYLERYPEVVKRSLAAVNFDMVGADQSKNKNQAASQLDALQPAIVSQRPDVAVFGVRRGDQQGAKVLQARCPVRSFRSHRGPSRLTGPVPVSVRQILRRQRPCRLHRVNAARARRRFQHVPRRRVSHQRRQPVLPRPDPNEAIGIHRTGDGPLPGHCHPYRRCHLGCPQRRLWAAPAGGRPAESHHDDRGCGNRDRTPGLQRGAESDALGALAREGPDSLGGRDDR